MLSDELSSLELSSLELSAEVELSVALSVDSSVALFDEPFIELSVELLDELVLGAEQAAKTVIRKASIIHKILFFIALRLRGFGSVKVEAVFGVFYHVASVTVRFIISKYGKFVKIRNDDCDVFVNGFFLR